MELIIEIFYCFLLSFLGGATFTLIAVWRKIKEDRRLDLKKFFGENKLFWAINVILSLVLSILLNLEPAARELVQGAGFVVQDGRIGFVWIGVLLAGGTNQAPKIKSVQEKNASGS